MNFKKYIHKRMKLSVVALVLGGGLIAQTTLAPSFITPSAYATDTSSDYDSAVDALAQSLVNLSKELNSDDVKKALLGILSQFSTTEWNQILFNSSTVSDSKETFVTNLSQFFTLGNTSGTLSFEDAKRKVTSVVSSLVSLGASEEEAIRFLQNLRTNANNDLGTILLDNQFNVKDAIGRVISNSYKDLPTVNAIFSSSTGDTGGLVGGGGATVNGTDPTSSTTSLADYRWLQQGTNESEAIALLTSLDPSKLQDELANVTAGTKRVIIPVQKNTNSVQLTSEVLSALRSKLNPSATLTFGNGTTTYDLPLSLIPTDIKSVSVSITNADNTTKQAMSDALLKLPNAGSQAVQLLGTPVDFNLTFDTPTGVQSIHDFGHVYVNRSLTVPNTNGFDPNTAAVVMWDSNSNSLLPVPATFVKDDNGTYHALIKRTGNSVYGIISNQKDFSDIQENWDWAKSSIDHLASHLVINGTGAQLFSPNADVTRAEFITMLIRGLGLVDKQVTTSADTSIGFHDVKAGDWFSKQVTIAKQLGLVAGDSLGNFNPNNKISRQEMATMIANAIHFVDANDANDAANTDLLNKFTDRSKIQPWAQNAVALAVKDGILSGRTADTFVPAENATRAEAAVMIERLLEHESLIDPVK